MTAGEVEVILRLRDQMSAQLKTATASLNAAGSSMTSFGSRVSRSLSMASAGFQTAGQTLRKFGTAASEAGSNMLPISAALGLAGGAAIKMSTDFERSMTKVITIGGAGREQMEKFRERVLEMSGDVGIGPVALADALVKVPLTALTAAQAMDVLNVSAKASSFGLGEAADIGKLLTSILTAYGSENMTAAHAADVMYQSILQGNFEANELADTLGRVVGITAEMGVSLEETAAFLSTFTRLGVKASEAITSVRGVMTAILHPGKQAREAFLAIGTSIDEVRDNIKTMGLTKALQVLLDQAKGDPDAIGAIIPNVRALAGVLGTAGAQGEAALKVMEAMSNSAGGFDKAMIEHKKTLAFAWQQFTAKVESAAVALGNEFQPHAREALETMSGMVDRLNELTEWFGTLSDGTQKAVLGFGTIVVAAAPVLMIVGAMGRMFGWVFGGIGTVLGGAGKSFKWLFGIATTAVRGIAWIIEDLSIRFMLFGDKVKWLVGGWDKFVGVARTVGSVLLRLVGGVSATALGVAALVAAAVGVVVWFAKVTGVWDLAASVLGKLWGVIKAGGSLVADVFGGMWTLVKDLAAAFGEWVASVGLDMWVRVKEAARGLADVFGQVKDKLVLFYEAMKVAANYLADTAPGKAAKQGLVLLGETLDWIHGKILDMKASWEAFMIMMGHAGDYLPDLPAPPKLPQPAGPGPLPSMSQKDIDAITAQAAAHAKALGVGAPPPALKPLSPEQAGFRRQMFGEDIIKAAQDMMVALGGVTNVSRMTHDEQVALNDALSQAVVAYRALGQQAPASMRAALEATGKAVVQGAKISDVVRGLYSGSASGLLAWNAHVGELLDKVGESIMKKEMDKLEASNEAIKRNLGIKVDAQKEAADLIDRRTLTSYEYQKKQVYNWREESLRNIDTFAVGGIDALLAMEAVFREKMIGINFKVNFGGDSLFSMDDAFKGLLNAPAARKAGESALTALTKSMQSGLPDVLMQALTGGGDFRRAGAALFGDKSMGALLGTFTEGTDGAAGKFSGKFGKKLQSMFGDKWGATVGGALPGIASMALGKLAGVKGIVGDIASYASMGSMFGPWGTAIGAGVGAIVGAFKKGANQTKKAREEFAKSLGFEKGDALYEKLRKMGSEGAALVEQALNKIGKGDKAANERWMEQVAAFMERFAASLDAAAGKLAAFGMKAPKALQPMVQELLKSTELTDTLRKQLEGMAGDESWEELQKLAEQFGIELSALGATFQQNRLGATADTYYTAFQRLVGAGADADAVLRGLSDEVQGLVLDAVKFGVKVPEFMRPMLQRMAEMGVLLDENGAAMTDLTRINFTDTIQSTFEKIRDVLEEIRDLLAGKIPAAASVAGRAIGGLEVGEDGKVRLPGMREPGADYGGDGFTTMPVPAMADGGIVRKPTLALVGEAGPEAVVPLGDMRMTALIPIQLFVGGSKVDEYTVETVLQRLDNNTRGARTRARQILGVT